MKSIDAGKKVYNQLAIFHLQLKFVEMRLSKIVRFTYQTECVKTILSQNVLFYVKTKYRALWLTNGKFTLYFQAGNLIDKLAKEFNNLFADVELLFRVK